MIISPELMFCAEVLALWQQIRFASSTVNMDAAPQQIK